MANVKCYYCKKTLKKESDECVKIAERRYAHKNCASIYGLQVNQDAKDKEALDNYLCKKFGLEKIDPKMEKQIAKYHAEMKFSYSGMLKALIYYYDIKKQSIKGANNGVGIIPYIWTEAYEYYHNIYQSQQQNRNFVPHEQINTIIKIAPPKRPINRRIKLFDLEGIVDGEDS